MSDVLTYEPEKVVAGDTWQWRREDLSADYPASEGWVLKYRLLNSAAKITIEATADGDAFAINVVAADTAIYAAGRYAWEASVSKGADRFRVGVGSIEVIADFDATATLDTRGHARRVLDNIEAVIERRATKDQEEFAIDGRSLKRTPISELMILRDKYKREVRDEENAERLKKGLGTGRMVLTRFGGN